MNIGQGNILFLKKKKIKWKVLTFYIVWINQNRIHIKYNCKGNVKIKQSKQNKQDK